MFCLLFVLFCFVLFRFVLFFVLFCVLCCVVLFCFVSHYKAVLISCNRKTHGCFAGLQASKDWIH